MTSRHAAPGTSTPCQSESVPNRHVASSSANRRTSAARVVALAQHGHVEPLPHRLRGDLGRAARGEQPERRAAGRRHELGDLVELGLASPAPAGRRQVPGDVEDALSRVVERAADVDPAPGDPAPRLRVRSGPRRRRRRAPPRSRDRVGRQSPPAPARRWPLGSARPPAPVGAKLPRGQSVAEVSTPAVRRRGSDGETGDVERRSVQLARRDRRRRPGAPQHVPGRRRPSVRRSRTP